MFEILVFFVLSVVIGLMFLFFGYPFFRILLPIWGFFAGISFGVTGMQSLFGANIISDTFGFAAGLVAGVILAVLAYFLYSIAIYIFGLSIGYILGSGVVLAMGANSGFVSATVGVICAVFLVIVFAMIKMPRFLVMLLTAVGGAMAVIMGIFVLFGQIPEIAANLQLTTVIVANSWFWIIIWIILAAIGLSFQYAIVQATNEDLGREYVWGQTPTRSKGKRKKKR